MLRFLAQGLCKNAYELSVVHGKGISALHNLVNLCNQHKFSEEDKKTFYEFIGDEMLKESNQRYALAFYTLASKTDYKIEKARDLSKILSAEKLKTSSETLEFLKENLNNH